MHPGRQEQTLSLAVCPLPGSHPGVWSLRRCRQRESQDVDTEKAKPPSSPHLWAADSVWHLCYNFLPAQAAVTNFRLVDT